MKRSIGLIAATLLTASIYSQDYSSSSSSTQNPDSTPPDYESRQSEAGAPATSESSRSSTTGYELSPGTSGGNSSTGQSSGYNVGVEADQGEDKTLTTRDSDLSGEEYRGTREDEPDASGSSATSESDSRVEVSEPLRGTGTVDGAFHEPAAPVRESSESEGWSGAGTFSGAGPGSVSGSASSSDSTSASTYSSAPSTSESSSSFNAEVSGNAALTDRDQDLEARGIEPDSSELSQDDSSNRVEGDMDQDQVLIFEDWTIVEPDTSVGGPADSDSGSGSSSDLDNRDHFDSTDSDAIRGENMDSYSRELYQRVQRDWSARFGNTDVPATPGIMDHEFHHLRIYNSETGNPDVGGPARSESGASSSDHDKECDPNKGSSAEFEEGELDSSVENRGSAAEFESDSESYHINRGEDKKYHINRSESDSSAGATSAPGEYGDRATSSNYDDGHLSGNNAAGSSGTSENSTSSSEDGALTPPDL